MRNEPAFNPLTDHMGAEVVGIDLREPLEKQTYRRLRGGLLEHFVLSFRDQEISPDQHVAFALRFGELRIHLSAPCVDNRPELMKFHADEAFRMLDTVIGVGNPTTDINVGQRVNVEFEQQDEGDYPISMFRPV